MSDRTKNSLVNALKKLLKTKSLNQITIQEIADECGVNRMTFYYHFHDIYDMIDWYFATTTRTLLDNRQPGETLQKTVLRVFEAIQEDREFIMKICQSVSSDRVRNFLSRMLNEPILNYIAGKADGMNVPPKDRQFIASFYRNALLGMVWDWIQDGEQDPSGMVEQLRILLKGNADLVLSNFEKNYR